MRRSRHGFTLIEVLVALMLGAFVLAGARAILEALGAQSAYVLHAARESDASANAENLLRRALADLEVRPDTQLSFEGDEASFSFRTECDVAQGWKEPCNARAAIERAPDGYRILLRQGADSAIELRGELAKITFRYLLTADEGGRWTASWHNTVMLPRAVGLITDDDTLVVAIGERR